VIGKMPILRDVRVPQKDPAPKDEISAGESTAEANLVTVMGFDKKDVLFRSDQVGCVQWRDSSGEIVALLIRIKPDIWGFSRRGEEDWPQVLERYGSPDIR